VLGKEYQFKLKPTGEPVEISAFAKVDKIEPDTLNPQLSFLVTLDKGLRDFGNQSESNNQHAQKMTRFIEASATECFEAICDFQAYHVWVKSLQEVKPMGSNPRRPITVKLVFNLLHLKKIEVTNRYTYDEENLKMRSEERRVGK
jgi:hypothetical protein